MTTGVFEVAPPLQGLENLTAEEYYASEHHENTELVNGKVVELMPTGFDHGEYASIIVMHLLAFVRKHNLGRVSVEAGYRLSTSPEGDTVRAPDISFLAAERLTGINTISFIDGPPTLAVEIISPSDLWEDIEEKVRLYLETGAQAVWLVEPRRRAVTVRRPQAASVAYTENDLVPGGEILPGFELHVREIFK
jgi:Uma2 family endonuclease